MRKIIREIITWFVNLFWQPIEQPVEPDKPLYREQQVTINGIKPINESRISIGINGRLFVVQEEGQGKFSVQEYGRDTFFPISKKVFSNPDAWRFGNTPLVDIGEYLLYKVKRQEALPKP